MTKLEEIAQAIHGCEYDEETSPLNEEHADIKKLLMRQARAAVEALRNPDDFMMNAAEAECDDEHRWVAIIDAILNETPEGKD